MLYYSILAVEESDNSSSELGLRHRDLPLKVGLGVGGDCPHDLRGAHGRNFSIKGVV